MFDEVIDTQTQPSAVSENESTGAEVTQDAPQVDSKQELKERNITALRERLENERQAREYAQKKLKDLEERLMQQEERVSHSHATHVPEEQDIPDDEIVDGRTYKTRIKKIEQRFEDKIKQLEERTRFESAERSMRERYPDFGQIVTETNLRNFQQLYPEEYTSMMLNPDPYARMKTAYTSMVNFGVTEQSQAPSYTQGKPVNRAQAPKSAASAPTGPQSITTPLSYVADIDGRRVLTEEMKSEMRRKIQKDKELLRSMGR
jgi:hypothetical protein